MDTPTPTSLDPKFRGPLPHMGRGGSIDLVTYGPMGYRRRSWGWRTTWKRSGRQSTWENDKMLSQFLLLLLGPFTCGLSWIGVVILAFASEPRFRRLESGCRTPLQIRNSRIAAQDSGGLDV